MKNTNWRRALSLSSGLASLGLMAVGVRAEKTAKLTRAQACQQLKSGAVTVNEAKQVFDCKAAGDGMQIPPAAANSLETPQREITLLRDAISGINFDNSKNHPMTEQIVADGAASASPWRLTPVADTRLADGPPGSRQTGTAAKGGDRAGSPVRGDERTGPPGAGNGGDRNGPPGSGNERHGPPGTGNGGDRNGPPGSGNDRRGPPNTTPPSRPAPVWRTQFPPPPPNWWNTTTWDHYEWWNAVPGDYNRPSYDRRSPELYLYSSGWYPWSTTFYSEGRASESETIIRRAQTQSETRSLSSRSYRDSKQCYYRAIYRYDWEEGGFSGSHWQERFDHYDARCIQQPRQWSRADTVTVTILFDMGQAERLPDGSLDLPWITDSIGVSYDGTNVSYDDSRSAFQYAKSIQSQHRDSETVQFTAGARKRTAPEGDKVNAFLQVEGGKVRLVVDDSRAKYYGGERLEIAVVVRWDKPWSLFDPAVMEHGENANPLIIMVDANQPQRAFNVPAFQNGEYWIDSFSFRRVNSALSTDRWMRKGQGNRISK